MVETAPGTNAADLPSGWANKDLAAKLVWLSGKKVADGSTMTLAQSYNQGATITLACATTSKLLKAIRGSVSAMDRSSSARKIFSELLVAFGSGVSTFSTAIPRDNQGLLAQGQYDTSAIPLQGQLLPENFDDQITSSTSSSDLWSAFDNLLTILLDRVPWLKNHSPKIGGATYVEIFISLKAAAKAFFTEWEKQNGIAPAPLPAPVPKPEAETKRQSKADPTVAVISG